ncbi:MAG: excinuclease ABC subunit B [Verrucomicrobia subdivision 6 bacterium BACL9 MAG-120507-bin52]|jgi:excinuclease ABC subunit B|uniref:UvrABC system protein B n=2 Tax=Verrucomicrobia subdivision 6 TaxID=134627 RepID=A0A0R2RRR1_9BACT|nr:MAG: excinuclease ABC subunit B [Verrucomicrobia subdivision 6 bacterium BACL9 MAG-120507-bin52]
MNFQIESPYPPAGDQPAAIAALIQRLKEGEKHNVLLGVTGSGKTFTVANVIQEMGLPTLVMSHNKTLAAQLYSELKGFFPKNAVEYFVSYFDYYQPEAYIPRTDTYIEKDSSINEEIERLRLSATTSLLTRKDVIVVASVSCIYGLGSPADYERMFLFLDTGARIAREELLSKLVEIQYERNDVAPERGQFRVRGDSIEVLLAHEDVGVRIELLGDTVDRLTRFETGTGEEIGRPAREILTPARHYVTSEDKLKRGVTAIRAELVERIAQFESAGKLLEAQRLKMRTEYDLDLMEEMGTCSGIENYSRHLSGRQPGEKPGTLIDFFPKDFLVVMDESHATVPQVGGMYAGDRSRKTVLVEHGFRLPSALDNRPLKAEEFQGMIDQVIYVSATPASFELGKVRGQVVEQVVRPTGLLDPPVRVRPLQGQVDETIALCRERITRQERVLVTTLTRRTAEDLSDYLKEAGLKSRYLHAEVDAIERVEILRELRSGEIDVLVGINLLREGLDLPEVSLVCILDADKEGYLRSETSLIQTAGRAARHLNGEVVLFGDRITKSMKALIDVTERRRAKQEAYNREHNIVPRSVNRGVQESLQTIVSAARGIHDKVAGGVDSANAGEVLRQLEEEMWEASEKLEYERAALLRDQIEDWKRAHSLHPPAKAGKQGAQPMRYVKPRRSIGKSRLSRSR